MAVVKGEGYRFEVVRRVTFEGNEKQQPEVIAKLEVSGVVVDEVPEIVENQPVDTMEHVGRMTRDQRCPGVKEIRGCSAHVRKRLASHVRTPMRRYEHYIAIQFADCFEQPCGRSEAEIDVGDAGAVGFGGEVCRMVGCCDDADAYTAACNHYWSACRTLIGTSTDARDPSVCEAGDGVEKRRRSVVEGVVVGEGDATDAEKTQHIDCSWRSAEEESANVVCPPVIDLDEAWS